MRILMLNRSDMFHVSGGDTIQMMQTKLGLEKLGVEVEVRGIHETFHASDFDVIHIFNWEQLGPGLSSIRDNTEKTPPVVLSTIFWFHTGHWFDDALSRKAIWKMINRWVGKSSSRSLFEKWQQAKFGYGEAGKRLRKDLTIPKRILPNSITEITHLKSALHLRGNWEARCTVIPNGVIRKLYDPQPAPSQGFYKEYGLEGFVLQVARIQSAKNQLGLIEALYNETIPIVFIGQRSPYELDYVNQCLALAKRRGNVFFIDPRSQEELPGIYASAKVHVLPSWRETPGLVSLEAGAAGCKVVSTSIGSAKDYFGDFAWYCNPRDPDSIKNAVMNALATPASNHLRNLILDQYTWDIAAQKTLEVYNQVMG